VFGAYFLLFPGARIIAVLPILFLPFFFEVPAVVYLGFWLLSQFIGGTVASLAPSDVGGVAWWAHLGGFAAGALLHRVFLLRRPDPPRRFERDELGIEGAWST
jgi:membrane associated rhomboid family serine protease